MKNIRQAVETDVSQMVELSEKKRSDYEKFQPVFWKKAKDSREKQHSFFLSQITKPNVIALVHEESGKVDSFVIGLTVSSPPVYDPGGTTCLIDDFVVKDVERWETIGTALLSEVQRQAQAMGAVQSVIFCGHLDESKRKMLSLLGFAIATETYVKSF